MNGKDIYHFQRVCIQLSQPFITGLAVVVELVHMSFRYLKAHTHTHTHTHTRIQTERERERERNRQEDRQSNTDPFRLTSNKTDKQRIRYTNGQKYRDKHTDN